MSAERVLAEVERRGVILAPSEAGDKLRFRPKNALTPELVEELRAHKQSILRLLSRREDPTEDPTPIEDAGEVFEMARARFGPSRRFDPSEHPPSKREMWGDPDKGAFFLAGRRSAKWGEP